MNDSLLVCALSLLLASCAGAPQVVEVTRQVEVTRLVVITAAPEPTATPLPTPTDTPFFVYHVADVIDAFREAGLPADEGTPDEPGGPAPSTEAEAYRFLIPSLGPDSGGRAFAFDSQELLDAKKAYYEAFTGMLFSWVFTRGNILVQINGSLPKAEADNYNEVLQSIP